ncbi:chromosome segregation protein SMC [Ruminococcus sp.]|uniref:chromosome segregation protein SMC n=1 Tax=Ruminococcus sp. TaxID=41978 RepID=UPI0025ED2816|nr:chromosome segregation protein SMC [Ruminococcus sp.]MCI6616204.1 chromosome segregation protein SMC [Ruminococcus sp.]
MRLKSLEVQGFKTFPDKTKLSFEQGITSVVGPNGSGKSNISDAIRWVLGEQSPKSLRCSKMEDVVFNGTDKRKRQGYAEVTLNIDNSDRFLDFNGDDIAVTRRYYRSGESEYLINKAAVRLKDINELFMDTGLGRDGYSMIGQGKIDSIVSSKSEERREIFEEAAGISRYRYRKIEAERKLKNTEDNLLRLRDIVTELEERVEPLRKQSEKAQQFLTYSEEKRGLEIALWLLTLDKSQDSLKQQDEKISIARAQYEEAEQTLQNIQTETEEIYSKNGLLSAQIENIRNEISQKESEISQKKSLISVAENDILHSNENIDRINNEILQTEQSADSLEKTISEKQERIAVLDSEIIEKQKKYSEISEKLNIINLDSSKSGDLLQEVTSELSVLTSQSADARVIDMTSESTIAELTARINALETSKSEKTSQISELEEIFKAYIEDLAETNDEINSLKNSIDGLELKLSSKEKKRNEYKSESEKLSLDVKEHLRKISFLENLERNLEGFSKSVKVVVNASKNGKLHGICGPVSRVISVPSKYGVAIETALGGAMQNIVVNTDEDAKQAIRYLKSTDGGRATFLPLNTIKSRELRENGLDDCYGFVGVASELCSCEEKYNNILGSLLGKIVIAEDLNSATAIAKKYSYRFKVVTLDGQVVNAGGSLTGGSLNRNTGLLSRASEIEQLKKLTDELQNKAKTAENMCEQVSREYSSIEAELLGTRADLSNKQQEFVRLEAEKRACESELNNAKSVIDNSDNEIKDCKSRIEKLKECGAQAKKQLAELNSKIAKAEERVNAVTGNRAELTQKREELTTLLQNIRLEIVTAQKDIDALNSEIVFAQNTGSDHEEKKAELLKQIESINNSVDETQKRIESLNDEIIAIENEQKALYNKIEEINTQKDALEKRSAEIRSFERDKNAERETSGRELARLEERKINLQKQYDDIISKLWEEYELTKREAEENAIEIEDSAKANKRLSELKQKIKGLGNVNVSAIEEYKEVSERYEFMSKQVNDVEKSKREIERLINDLIKQMKEVFVESFDRINKNFTYTFKELFGGGTASLSLSDPENILTSGIDILVHPPGKIVVHLDALSGGEKALVAIALYFAIMKVRPAPFCVMDEIEAALDDVNVYRFASYLRRLTDNTQFILITHRRGTMEEADVLYGVTMQDEGISKLLELRSTEVAEKLGIDSK